MVGARVIRLVICIIFTNVLLIIGIISDNIVVIVFLESKFRSFLVVKYSLMHIRSVLLTRMHVDDGCCQYRSLDSFY